MNNPENNSIATNLHLALKGKYIKTISIGIILGITAFLLSFLLPKQFASEALIYPTSTNSNEELITKGVEFGSEKDVQEHIQILRSTQLRDSIIQQFKLVQHYQLEGEDSLDSRSQAIKIYNQRIKILRNSNGSISVHVLDKSAVVSAKLANSIVILADIIKSRIIKKNIARASLDADSSYQRKINEVALIVQEANLLRSKNYAGAIQLQKEQIRKANQKRAHHFNQSQRLNAKSKVLNYEDNHAILFEMYLDAENDYYSAKGEFNAINEMNLDEKDSLYVNVKKKYAGAKMRYEHMNKKFSAWKKANKNYANLKELEEDAELHQYILTDLERKLKQDASTFAKEYYNFDLLAIEKRIESELSILNHFKKRKDQYSNALMGEIPKSYVINPATPNYQPVKPNKLFNASAAFLASLLLQVMLYALKLNYD